MTYERSDNMTSSIRKIPPKPVFKVKKRVCAYARVSSDKDAMLHSLSAQVSYYKEYITNIPDAEFVGVYSDEAFTGTKEQRPGLMQMLSDCRAGRIDMVITKSISRFARNVVTLLKYVRELKELNVDVYFEEQNIHTISSDGELMLTILASYAQEESRSASENRKWQIRHGFEEGKLVNLRFLLGYNITKGEITVNEPEAAIVREIFRRAVAGESFTAIADDLNSRGITGKQGGRWNAPRIRDTLSNEKYTGNALLQKHYKNNHIEKKKTKNTGELAMYYVEGSHPAIIDNDTFNAAQEILHRLDAIIRKKPTLSPLTGIIRCGVCGGTFHRVSSKTKTFWLCSVKKRQGKDACSSERIPDSIISAEYERICLLGCVKEIRAYPGRQLVFIMDDDTEHEVIWKGPSRSDGWTAGMREKAREREKSRHE